MANLRVYPAIIPILQAEETGAKGDSMSFEGQTAQGGLALGALSLGSL